MSHLRRVIEILVGFFGTHVPEKRHVLSWTLRIWRERLGLMRMAIKVGQWRGARHIIEDAIANRRRELWFQPSSESRPVVLVIDRCLPDPTLDSGSVRMLAIMSLLKEMGYDIIFIADTVPVPRFGAHTVSDVQFCCQPLGNLVRLAKTAKLAWLVRFQTVNKHAQVLRAVAPDIRLAFDTVDLHYLRESRRLGVNPSSDDNAIVTKIRAQELGAARAADTVVTVSEVEASILRGVLPECRIYVLSNIHERIDRPIPGWSSRRDVLFIGGTHHLPNLDVLKWLKSELWRAIRKELPEIKLHIVGQIQSEEIKNYGCLGIYFHGQVTDLSSYLESALVSIAPLRFGAGVKGKINTAMSHGLPVIATTLAIEGMDLTPGVDVEIADTPLAFASTIAAISRSSSIWSQLSKGGLESTSRNFSRTRAREALNQIFSTLEG